MDPRIHKRWLSVWCVALVVLYTSPHPRERAFASEDRTGVSHELMARWTDTPDGPERSLMLVDDQDEWFSIPVNCGIVANPVPSGVGFYKGGPAEYWFEGRQPASGPFIAWEDHAYWTGAASRWNDHDNNNWAIWAPELPGHGMYTVEVFVPRMGTGQNFDTRAATYQVRTESMFGWDEEVTIDPLDNLGGWVELGTWEFTNTDRPGGCGGGPTIMLTDVSSDVGSAISFDAVRLTEAEDGEEDFVSVEFDEGCDVRYEPGERATYYHYSHVGGALSIFRYPDGARLAIRATAQLAPGAYTAIVRGVQGSQGVGLVEVFTVSHGDSNP